jgi:hypothetical protein
MSEVSPIIELTSKGQEIMARMASEHAEATRVPTRMELSKELEAMIQEENPNFTLADVYISAYGILLANTTKEKLSEIIAVWKAN